MGALRLSEFPTPEALSGCSCVCTGCLWCYRAESTGKAHATFSNHGTHAAVY